MASLTRALSRAEMNRPRITSRDVLANIFLAAWICVILQGALRKWAFPGVQALYLVQDVPLLIAYVYALYHRLFWANWLAWSCVFISVVLAIQSLLQLIAIGLPMMTLLIGLHQYIFYLPILFILPVCFNRKNRVRFLRLNLLGIIPMAAIATLQSRSPHGAWINRTSAGDNTAFSISGTDAFRCSGTFNFTLPFSVWCGIAVALVIGEWLQVPSRRSFKSTKLLLLCTVCAGLETAVSGSRTAVVLAAAAFFGGFLSVLITRNTRHIQRFAALMILLPVLAGLAYLVAPKSFIGVERRFSGQEYQEEMVTRVESMTVGFLTEPKFNLIGMGIGKGIQATQVGARDAYSVSLSEWDTIRGVQEMGSVTGVALVLARYLAAVVFFAVAAKALMRRSDLSFGLPLAFCTIPTLAIGDIWRVAPEIATQAYFCIAFVCGTILFRRETNRP